MTATEDHARTVFLAALEREPAGWPAFLDEACAGDADLRARVEQLLHAHQAMGSIHAGGDLTAPSAAATVDAPPLREAPGSVIGPYKLLDQLGEGGMGVVFMAEQQRPVRRRVALKVIKAGMDTRQVIGRFEAERQALALMDHPNIARVLDAGATDSGRPYFVMELVKGVPITRYCDERRLTPRDRLELFVQVCQAVQHAHTKGIIHRDLKPSNVLVAQYDGRPVPKVIDFGVAKATGGRLTDATVFTGFGALVGTPEYMSPEQAGLNKLDVDTRSDVYSLGVLLYELLTGTTPLELARVKSAALLEVLRLVREEESPRPSTRLSRTEQLASIAACRGLEPRKLGELVRGELDWLVMRALEKDRNRRYETANALARDVQRYLNHEPVEAFPPSPVYRLSKLVRRHPAVASVFAVLVVACAVSTVLAVWALQSRDAKVAALSQAAAERDAANYERRSNRIRLVEAYAREGWTAVDNGDPSTALLWFVRSLEAAAGESVEEDNARLRIASTLPLVPRLLDVIAGTVAPNGEVIGVANGRRIQLAAKEAHIISVHPDQPPTAPLQHNDKVCFAAFSPNGDRIATASFDHTVRIWDAKTGQPLTPPMCHSDQVRYVAFNPDGSKVVTASDDHTALLWDANTGAALAPPMRHGERVWSAAFSADGTMVTTFGEGPTSEGRTARVWDTKPSEATTLRLQYKDKVRSATFNRDGSKLVTAYKNDTVRVWDSITGKPLSADLTHSKAVNSVVFSPSEAEVVTASSDGTARVWDYRADRQVTLQHEGAVNSAVFSPDGTQVATASSDRTARVWNAMTGKELVQVLHKGIVSSAAFSVDGNDLVTASDDGTACVWNAGSGQLLATLQHKGYVNFAVFSPTGREVMTASNDYTARVWNARTGAGLTQPMAHEDRILFAGFSPDGSKVVTASDDHSARVWDAKTGLPLTPPLRHWGTVWSAVFSPDGLRLATVGYDSTARVWDVRTGQPLTPVLRPAGGPRSAASFSPDGTRVATASYEGVSVWDIRSCSWPVADLKAMAELVAGQWLDQTDGLVPIAAADGRQRMKMLCSKYPETFRPEPTTAPSTGPAKSAAGS